MDEDLQTNYHSYYSTYGWKIVGYADFAFGAIIIISNTLVILVLTRKKLSPMDFIFIHISIIESLAALAYVPHVWHEFFRVTLCSIPQHRTLEWEKIALHSYAASFLFHTARIWLSVMLALWRYIAISHPLKVRTWCNLKITHISIIAIYIFSFIITIPLYFSTNVGKVDRLLDQNGCLTTDPNIGQNTTIYEFKIALDRFWYTIVWLGYGILLKTVPSLILAVIIHKLIIALLEMKKSNEEMALDSKNYYRTTIILVLILVLFITAEIPNGIYASLSGFFGPRFHWKYYYRAIEILNCVAYISESFNFIIYYTLSNQFRQTFKKMFNCTNENKATLSIIRAQKNVNPSSSAFKTLGSLNQIPN